MKDVYSRLDKKIDWQKLDKIVKKSLKKDKSGHDYAHTIRVLKNARLIAKFYPKTDYNILIAACYLHDISYIRGFCKNHHLVGAKLAPKFLREINFPKNKIEKVQIAIEDHVGRVAKPVRKNKELQIESKILRDADNIDALGKIGLERQIAFCKNYNIPFFKSKEDKFNESAYGGIKEIITWADRMLTPEGKKIGQKRTKIMKDFLRKVVKRNS